VAKNGRFRLRHERARGHEGCSDERAVDRIKFLRVVIRSGKVFEIEGWGMKPIVGCCGTIQEGTVTEGRVVNASRWSSGVTTGVMFAFLSYDGEEAG
jgi:hypothetical protein